ncbi:MAG: ROK family protein [Ilumatobacteraceae bacterium]
MHQVSGPVEHLHVRRHNLSLILRLLATQGPRSRAGLASVSGLTRATVSSLVAELIDRGLVDDAGPEADQRVGRPATLVRLDGAHVVTVGIEVDVGLISVLVADLGGREIARRRHPIGERSTAFDSLVDVIADEARHAIADAELSGRRVAGLSVAIPGVVDADSGVVRRAPNLDWTDVPLGYRLAAAVGAQIPVACDNEANLAAVAEHRLGRFAGARHLVYVFAMSGVGSGVIVDGTLLRGASGFAGEVGHMTVEPGGATCACGNRGCWETTIGIRTLLVTTVPDLAPLLLGDRRLAPEQRIAPVAERAESGDPVALAGLGRFGEWLGVGLANIVDAYNPEVIVLGGFLPLLAEWIEAPARRSLAEHALGGALAACRLEFSSLGLSAGAVGGTILAAARVFDDPTLVPSR